MVESESQVNKVFSSFEELETKITLYETKNAVQLYGGEIPERLRLLVNE